MEKAEVVEVGAEVVEERAEVVQRMKNCHSVYVHRSYIESSSVAPWIVSTASTATYLSHGAHIAPCISCRPPQVASTLTHSVHKTDYEWTPISPNRPSSRHRAWRI